jgi:hypothetical protein
MKLTYKTAVFKSYENGYYTFMLNKCEAMVFEEVHPQILLKYDVENDKTLISKLFHLAFLENKENVEEDFINFRMEYLERINSN